MVETTPVESRRGVYVLKQSADIYTMMLVLSLLFVMVGCLFLFLEMKSYEGLTTKLPPDAKAPQAMWIPPRDSMPRLISDDRPVASWSTNGFVA